MKGSVRKKGATWSYRTAHPNNKYLSDADPKNTFDIEKFLKRKLRVKSDDVYETFEVNVS